MPDKLSGFPGVAYGGEEEAYTIKRLAYWKHSKLASASQEGFNNKI